MKAQQAIHGIDPNILHQLKVYTKFLHKSIPKYLIELLSLYHCLTSNESILQ